MGPGASPRVLLVEDDRDTREMYTLYLEQSGCVVEQAHNGNQAFSKVIERFPDVVVTDLAIPGLDGFSLCRKLKLDERTCELPIIALTGRFLSSEDVARARSEGCETVLLKPCLPETLLSEIHSAMHRSRTARQR
jgi:DNA-binding response OmpR family regulator